MGPILQRRNAGGMNPMIQLTLLVMAWSVIFYLATLSRSKPAWALVPEPTHLAHQGCAVCLFIAVSLSAAMLSGPVRNPWLPLKWSTGVW